MKTLIIYDSAYGNTAKIARAIEKAMRAHCETQVCLVADTKDISLVGVDLLVVGSPTQGGRPTVAIQEYLRDMPRLNGLKVAAFDTRYAKEDHGFGLKLLMSTIGFAAGKIAATLTNNGGDLASYPEGFIVNDKSGPLREGELERAAVWAAEMAEKL